MVHVSRIIYNTHLLDSVPEQGVVRFVTQNYESWTQSLEREGLGFQMEWGFYLTEMGIINYGMCLTQIDNATVNTACVQAVYALLHCKSADTYYESMGLSPTKRQVEEAMQRECTFWGILNKSDGFVRMQKIASEVMAYRMVQPDLWIVSENMIEDYRIGHRSEQSFMVAGPSGPDQWKNKGPIPTLSKYPVFEANKFQLAEKAEPEDLLEMRRAIGEMIFFTHEHHRDIDPENYASRLMNPTVLDHDSNKMTELNLKDFVENCCLFLDNGELSPSVGGIFFKARAPKTGRFREYLSNCKILNEFKNVAGPKIEAIDEDNQNALKFFDRDMTSFPYNGLWDVEYQTENRASVHRNTEGDARVEENRRSRIEKAIVKADESYRQAGVDKSASDLSSFIRDLKKNQVDAVADYTDALEWIKLYKRNRENVTNNDVGDDFQLQVAGASDLMSIRKCPVGRGRQRIGVIVHILEMTPAEYAELEQTLLRDLTVINSWLIHAARNADKAGFDDDQVRESIEKVVSIENTAKRVYDVYKNNDPDFSDVMESQSLTGAGGNFMSRLSSDLEDADARRLAEDLSNLIASKGVEFSQSDRDMANNIAHRVALIYQNVCKTVLRSFTKIKKENVSFASKFLFRLMFDYLNTHGSNAKDAKKSASNRINNNENGGNLPDLTKSGRLKAYELIFSNGENWYALLKAIEDSKSKRENDTDLKVRISDLLGEWEKGSKGDGNDKDLLKAILDFPVELFCRDHFLFLIDYNFYFPFHGMALRPHIEWTMASIILMKQGSQTGNMFIGFPHFVLSANGQTKMLMGHMTLYMGPVIKERQNIFIVHNAVTKHYNRGGGVEYWKPFNPEHLQSYQNPQNEDVRYSLFAVPLYPDKPITNRFIDITGRFPPNMQTFSDQTSGKLHYDLAEAVSRVWGWTIEDADRYFHLGYYPRSSYRNTKVAVAHQWHYAYTGQGMIQMGHETLGTGHFPYSYTGCVEDRCGRGENYMQLRHQQPGTLSLAV
jgi:hypothetical protein